MNFVWVYAAAVPRDRKESFTTHAREAAEMFKCAGALSVQENWACEDVDGKLSSFPVAVGKADDEDVVVGWVIWPDEDTAQACMASMEDDPKWQDMGERPHDGKRMLWGHFRPVLIS
ncbi:DUF1428 domain-containing protein [Palleronia abyssalis]|uniref:DUF1428 domain-containing protein n=1 Tax=Palleronia abyssalis TaxID=1501240 RepID=A0A2R8BUK5_9RHOB|nr:DUF1428 domain-containing protein [Palleronia abyssalis]SPJ23776.1 hypothetical protein PAA8504_01591 [Palleronia abyssalis]